jgi:hypothetical protein
LNDTLIGIARQFHISLEELLAANPDMGSQPLIVGKTLTIPPEILPSGTTTPTPIPVVIRQIRCYPNKDGSLTCLVLLENTTSSAIQNLSITVSLEGSDQTTLGSQSAYSITEVLLPGKSTVLSAFFQSAPLVEFQPHAVVLTATVLPVIGNRYVATTIQNPLVQVNWGGLSAHVEGTISLSDSAGTASQIRILGTAFDRSGNVVGYRLWENGGELSPGKSLAFDFIIASFGPGIDHIELSAEAVK